MKLTEKKDRKSSRRMGTQFVYAGQRFRWNTEKALANFKKHGIPFEQACEAFFDPFVRPPRCNGRG